MVAAIPEFFELLTAVGGGRCRGELRAGGLREGHAGICPQDALGALDSLRRADIVIGIPSFQNARTIGHVVRAAHAGLAKYFPQYTSVIINSDGGSTDGTREAVLSTRVEDSHVLLLSHPLSPVHRLSVPYHGIPGKGSAFRLVFEMAAQLGARACAVVDSDLRSITPEWIDLLVRPVLHAGLRFRGALLSPPQIRRHHHQQHRLPADARALRTAGAAADRRRFRRVRTGCIARYLEREDDWETDVARYGIDIWMTTVAISDGFRVCQSFLGAKLHDAKDPGADLSAMLRQVVGSVFELMQQYEAVWRAREGSEDVDLFGFRYDVGLDPIAVDIGRMLTKFRQGCHELSEIWSAALKPETNRAIMRTVARGGCRAIPSGRRSVGARDLRSRMRAQGPDASTAATCCARSPRYTWRAWRPSSWKPRTCCRTKWKQRSRRCAAPTRISKPYLLANWTGNARPAAALTRPAAATEAQLHGDET